MTDNFIIVTDAGSVLISINPQASNGLDPELLQFAEVTDKDRETAAFETPLRAFSAKMVDIINSAGFDGVTMSGSMRDMMVREKAVADLSRIERWAAEHLG